MASVENLNELVTKELLQYEIISHIALGELTLDVPKAHIVKVCETLRDHAEFHFEQLSDLCGVDYSTYGEAEWSTEENTYSGFSRAKEKKPNQFTHWDKPRFGVIYHLLSVKHNHRIRLRTFVDESDLFVDSVIDIWNVANFFEREAFDLYGILFKNHPDLRRVLTDYGFIGHPFRKDFPLSGHVEPRYDAALARVVYEPVDIKPRTLVPRVIRDDNRYLHKQKPEPTE